MLFLLIGLIIQMVVTIWLAIEHMRLVRAYRQLELEYNKTRAAYIFFREGGFRE